MSRDITLKDYIHGNDTGRAVPISSSLSTVNTAIQVSAATENIVALAAIPSDKRENFGQIAADIVTSEEFIDELSKKVGEPRERETEDQFVARAKGELVKILKCSIQGEA
jgi:hypothetical protein